MTDEARLRIRKTGWISTAELERRWKAVRQAMKERKLDFLIMQSSTDYLGGYMKWFTDVSAGGNYTATVIFPREEDMITITSGGRPPAEPNPPAWVVRGIKKRINVPIIPSLGYSAIFDAEKAVEELAPYKNCRIGLVNTGLISASFYIYVTKHLSSSAKFEDATDLVDDIKAIKSNEEIECIREAAAIQEAAFEYVLKRIRPGMRDYDVYNDLRYKVTELGSEQGFVSVGSAPAGKPARFSHLHYGNRMIEYGDQIHYMTETNGPSGMYTETMRTICIGKVPAELEEHFELSKQAQKLTVDLLKEGADALSIFEANNAFMRKIGYPEETRIFAHGQGYDLVERPSLNPGETMKIKARMNIAVHPTVASNKAFGMVCDGFIIHENGEVECLHRWPPKIWVI